MKKLVYILLIVIASAAKQSQAQNIDSLKLALKNAKHDTTRCNILNAMIEAENDDNVWPKFNAQLKILAEQNITRSSLNKKIYLKHLSTALNNNGSNYYLHGDISKAIDSYQKSLKIRYEIDDKIGIASLLNNLGTIYDKQGDITKALKSYNTSLDIREEIGDKKGVGNSLNNIANIYLNKGDIPKALDYFHKSFKIREELGDKVGISSSLNNIGFIYEKQGDIEKAFEYYNKSLNINTEIGNKSGMAMSLISIATAYFKQGNFSKSLEYNQRSLKIREEISDKVGVANVLNNIGKVYFEQGDILKAIDCHNRALKSRKEVGDKKGIAQSLNNLAKCLIKIEQTDKALTYAISGFKVSQELGFPESINQSANILKQIYKKQNKHKEALEMYELEIQMRDSISNTETRKASIKKQFQYQYEKKAAADSVKNGEEQKVKNALLTAQQAQLKQEKTKSYALYGGLALVLVFAGFMVNRFRVTNKQKQIIELKEIETQKQNVVITHQKHLVEEKHKEITDSINYAERIQRSFLATKDMLDENLNNYFVLFKPKDVVSGDFYWASILNNGNFALVTADSTGHGVPGAIMSLLNITSLEKAVEHLHNPNDILNSTRKTIIERLKKDGSEHGGKDGMDASLIAFDFKVKQLHIAAANNPVWIIRENTLIEIKPDKMPVGKHDKDTTPFTQQTIDLQTGDVIYAITDGYPDQFGGEKGKKFMSKNLKELLQANAHLPMDEQKAVLDTTFKNWVGDLEQVDDVTIIGVRV